MPIWSAASGISIAVKPAKCRVIEIRAGEWAAATRLNGVVAGLITCGPHLVILSLSTHISVTNRLYCAISTEILRLVDPPDLDS